MGGKACKTIQSTVRNQELSRILTRLMFETLKARLRPFRHRDFRNFFFAQTLSLVGTWSHDLARSWLVIAATGSNGSLGTLNTAVAVPCLFLILQGGVLVDRTDVRKLIQRTKSLLGISSIVLAALTEFSGLEMWHLIVFALIEGVITAYDSPAFQALIVRMIPREDFQQALALNSTNFHTSRMLGPIVAAWLMSLHGPSLVFLFDGVTYFLVAFILAGTQLRSGGTKLQIDGAPRPSLREGLRYMYGNLALRYRILQLMLTLICMYPLMVVIFRVYVQKKFALDAKAFGEVFSLPALGSMMGALSFTAVQPREPIRALWFGVPLLFVMLLIMPWLHSLPTTVACMTVVGFALYLIFASLTVSMQLEVDDAFRGRLSSVIGLGFSAIGPLMGWPFGVLADLTSPPFVIITGAGLFGLGSASLAWLHGHRPALKRR